ncbi:methyltransferase [Dasania sp. GY-MA-18]|uniref:Methyltransferase n=1 Tax=Dasania phycosphaerae TaxID=2950436 RepID=A0A9J6RIB4_9GAMM|nr:MULTISPECIES: methyltransferase [Dasania]MCR8921775.1 methyltransferase [Dasania sp. GY-MA-18]MCZ0864203.1 methyltransferase [Dasania phycosphaerae]MCZ0867931.1 methyltransferase [Dasania phycosphaerae]
MNTEIFNNALARVQLQRLPLQHHQSLRAWDAADELLLKHIAQQQLAQPHSKVLVINDHFGALSVSLAAASIEQLSHWGDSHISQLATAHNLKLNQLTTPIHYLSSVQSLSDCYDLIVIKLPKVSALLETQLNGLAAQLTAKGQIIAAGMCKHMPMSSYRIFERLVGPTTTSKAEKKARLIFPQAVHQQAQPLPYPITFTEPSLGLTLSNHANVFSKESLDIGARFFIQHFKQLPSAEHIIDLGCGNGVLGIMARRFMQQQGVNSQIHFVDESYMAVASAQLNYQQAYHNLDNCSFHHSECLSQLADISADLILCNPPFHQQHTVGDYLAKRMFKHSYSSLKPQGQLWVVANKQLPYAPYLKNLFGHCTKIASNKKFVIYQAIKQ